MKKKLFLALSLLIMAHSAQAGWWDNVSSWFSDTGSAITGWVQENPKLCALFGVCAVTTSYVGYKYYQINKSTNQINKLKKEKEKLKKDAKKNAESAKKEKERLRNKTEYQERVDPKTEKLIIDRSNTKKNQNNQQKKPLTAEELKLFKEIKALEDEEFSDAYIEGLSRGEDPSKK